MARPIGRSASSVAENRIDWPWPDQQQVVVGRAQHGADQFVAVAQIDRDQPPDAVGVVLGQPGLLDQAVLGGEHQVRRVLVALDVDDLRDPLLGLEGQQVGDVLAAGGPAASGSS